VSLGFGTLTVIVLAGLAGPMLALAGSNFLVPVAIGELLAGVLVGPEGIGLVDPSNPTVSVIGEIGFAMLMLSAGMHLPLGERRLGPAVRTGAVAEAIVLVLAVPAGLLAALVAGTGHAAVFAVVLASGSAAVLLPAFTEARLDGREVLTAIAQVAIADLVTIVAVPIVLQPGHVGHVLAGAGLVGAAALLLFAAARALDNLQPVHELRALSKRRYWALDLRVSLLVLFLLAWLAKEGGTSVLIAGFGAGLLVAALGGPKRLSTQMRGVAEGFFVPAYFVVLGGHLDLGGLFSDPSLLALAGALVVLNVGVRLVASALMRRPAAGALAVSAQLGVPAAVASLGIAEHVLDAGTATAIVTSALISLGICSWGVSLLARSQAQATTGAGSSPGSGRPAAV
jgi:Kef-type K+ transport system membrane component KefB